MSETESTALDQVQDGLPVMSKKELLQVALEHGGYSTPSLNDSLYLHYKGYRCIENLNEYTGLKSLWLHSNALATIENLSHLTELRCLFLQRNYLTEIENLQGLNSLVQLDLSENNIRVVEGLSHLTNLTTLNLSKNVLEDATSIQHLAECKNLSAVDLSHNKLAGKDIVDCIAGNQKLTSLNISGNPVCSKVAYFRKKMIVANKSLRYFDRPIFDNERATAEEWAKVGPEAERELKEKLQEMKQEKERNALEDFRQWQASVRSTAVVDNADVDDNAAIEERLIAESGAIDVEVPALLEPDAVAKNVVETGKEPHNHFIDSFADTVAVAKVEGKDDVAETEKENVEPPVREDFCATTNKPLKTFVNMKNGERLSLEELLAGAGSKQAVVLPPDALSFDVVSSDDDSSS